MSIDVYFVAAVLAILTTVFASIKWMLGRHRKCIEQIVSESSAPLNTRLSVMEAKLDMFLTTAALDAAKILHHPEPSRFHIDALLDKLLDNHLTCGEADELRGYLRTIRDWEPGQDVGFKVFPGEQVAASILLITLDHAMEKTRRG